MRIVLKFLGDIACTFANKHYVGKGGRQEGNPPKGLAFYLTTPKCER